MVNAKHVMFMPIEWVRYASSEILYYKQSNVTSAYRDRLLVLHERIQEASQKKFPLCNTGALKKSSSVDLVCAWFDLLKTWVIDQVLVIYINTIWIGRISVVLHINFH